jgi:hypothetical protein
MSISPVQLPVLWRCSLLVAAWLCAFLALTGFSVLLHPLDLILHPVSLFVAGFFPLGLSAFFDSDLNSSDSFYGWLIFGWSAYLGLCVVTLRQVQARKYLLVYSILCVLLVLNVVGCRVNKAAFQIQPF